MQTDVPHCEKKQRITYNNGILVYIVFGQEKTYTYA